VRLVTGSGYIIAAQVQVAWLQCLGRKVDQMVVVAHTLPFGSLTDGLLGMDFLRRVSARILLPEGVIDIP
jgi:predicted aspartyl protease